MVSLVASEYSLFKRITGFIKTLSTNGVGRTFIRINKKYKFISDYRLRRCIKFCKKLFHPVDRYQRFSHAKKLKRCSTYANFIPKETGYRPIKLSDIPEAEKAISACRDYLKNLDPARIDPLVGHRVIFQPLLREDAKFKGIASAGIYDLKDIPGLTELMMSETMAEMASCYFGEVPIMASANLYMSLPNDTAIGSQVYHTDAEDFQQLQFIFAITDIDEETGPFTLIPADKTKLVLGKRHVGTSVGRLPDQEIYDVVGENAKVQLTGPAGSCWAVDTTRCLHFGSRGNKKIRCHLQMQYVSRFSPSETLFHFSGLNASIPSQLSKLQKQVLSEVQLV